MDFGLWTTDFGLWTLDYGLWTTDFGLWTTDFGLRLWITKLLVCTPCFVVLLEYRSGHYTLAVLNSLCKEKRTAAKVVVKSNGCCKKLPKAL